MRRAEIRRDEEEKAVSPVIATILMVAITVVLAGVLYVWANNLASEGTDTSVGTLNTYTTEDAEDETGPGADDTLVKMQMTGKDDLAWSFIKITLSVGDNVYTCSVIAGDDCQISQAAGDNDNAWEPGEYLFLSEGTDDICSEAECLLQISVTHNGRTVAGDGVSGQGGNVGSGSVDTTPTDTADTTPPVITVPTDMTVDYQDAGNANTIVTFSVSATDDVAMAPDTPGDNYNRPIACKKVYPSGSEYNVQSPSLGYFDTGLPVGTTTITCTATDEAGNVATGSFTVTVSPPPDSDGDGVPDSQDQCPGYDDNVDVDVDGISDGCDDFIDYTVSANADYAEEVYATDLDGDGDVDFLSASRNDKIAWYENDGSESFTSHTITTSARGATSVYAADVDGDGDQDVLSASYSDDRITWYENDGSESFTSHTIYSSASYAMSVFAIDVDGDGDMDVLSASIGDDKIAWFENDGSESFTTHIITSKPSQGEGFADAANCVYATDMDGDGDVDVLSASYANDKVAWYENDGSESFTAHEITTSANGVVSVYANDVDGDGDMDVQSASYIDNKVIWYENDGSESFTAHIITSSASGASSVFSIDMDGDGDMDILSSSWGSDTIAWYENDGSESFTTHQISTRADFAGHVFAIDVDGDGDIDVLSASSNDDTISWYENN
jgi:flagellin-like protein